MSDTPAIETLRLKRRETLRQRDRAINDVQEKERQLRYRQGELAKLNGQIVDFDRAIKALSYPDE